ncbi:trypsin-like serine peptidase [Pseudotabrizicola formosa]|uniref:trypsin-like serine peptidase n=1 Tax=Pseudotabrizicola formosa TaxID=2030009 RepID=UPI00143DEE6A|nr:trypsin-like serine protease [Pseudotabrizicola formosa]
MGLAWCLGLLAAPVAAQTPPPGLGRISQGASVQPGSGICTGALVAADLVLTAAHCVRGAVKDPTRLRFHFGWRKDVDGRSLGPADRRFFDLRHGVEVLVIDAPDGPGLAALASDVALIRLNRLVMPDQVAPLALTAPGRLPPLGTVFELFAFDRQTPDQLGDKVTCRLVGVVPGLLGLDCPAVSGNSGAPVLLSAEGGGSVSAVMVAATAAGRGEIRSWAVLLPDWLRDRVTAANVSRAKQ